MKFLIDAQLPIALARFIRQRGHIAVHVADLGLAGADDQPIWQRAIDNAEIIVSKDEDFAFRRMLNVKGPIIIWLRIGNCSNQELLKWFGSIWSNIEIRFAAGDSLIEVV